MEGLFVPVKMEVVEVYEVEYSELLQLSSSSNDEKMIETIIESLGPTGSGLIAITGVSYASNLRSQLLPLARKLALLNPHTRNRILKEHNLGSDVPLKNPDRSVSSFAMKLGYAKAQELNKSTSTNRVDSLLHFEENSDHIERESYDTEFRNLGSIFKELGFCMMELGLCLARICDRAIGGIELEQSLLDSCAAKGRLIHYHSSLDGLLLKESERSTGTGKRRANVKRGEVCLAMNGKKSLEGSDSNSISHDDKSCGIHSNLWQQWHYDYGIFTVLTAPFFMLPSYSETTKIGDLFPESCYDECPSPIGHTCLQIYDPNKKRVLLVRAPPDSFIIQVGESADIISRGKLRSTLHSVHRPAKFENLSRETFVVFLQPAWTKTFSMTDPPHANSTFNDQCSLASDDEQQLGHDNYKLSCEIQKIVPPLSSRLKDGMTFAEFSRETTKQYYGGSGLQSNR
ncbi:PREDICTED: uncharacterized protein LOC109335007 isoform X2 [Lupinus angustifolius]|uniref:uncharacterized protein LOC109335007 isoform X2 n=1 Tax=Lupinus angustifolius TaxID=3871 RepID=UPI00092F3CF2|nr:PREDICTED: uncharacterized protein LOC109335007 isoform X2 [Lupinus angustifolius]